MARTHHPTRLRVVNQMMPHARKAILRRAAGIAAAAAVALLTAIQAHSAPGFRSARMPAGPTAADYMRILSRFPLYAERGWHEAYEGAADVGYFGSGRSDENGQRTLANFILVYALLATEPGYDASASGVPRDQLESHALAAIRYWMRTHLTQDLTCTDGNPWGHHWQSSWWTSKALTGADLLWDRLTEAEKERLALVVASEADRLCEIPIPTGEYGDTKSEENAWYSETLAWAVCLYPTHPRAPAWRERFNAFCMNALSVAADLRDDRVIAGRRVREWVVGPNVHSDFTIENHGFFHICYMSCPLHSLAWNVYVFRRFGQEPPAPIFHHARDVWHTLLRFALWEGRFAYVGGKDWPRYAYGLYFILPALVVQQQYSGDAVARLIEAQRVATFEREQCHWADGSFFSGRFTHGRMEGWPSEWETDCACMLAMAYLLHKQAGEWPQPASSRELDRAAAGVLLSRESRQISLRGRERFAAVSYHPRRGATQVTFGARGAEDMMEWDGNLSGTYAAEGFSDAQRVERHCEVLFDGGFASASRIIEGERRQQPERTADGPPRFELRLTDENSRVGAILTPHHPLFLRPYRVTSLAGMATLDTIEHAAPAWRVLAADVQGRPAIVQARMGKGVILIVMAEIAGDYVAGKPTGQLFENLVDLLRRQGPRLGYVPTENIGQRALDQANVRYEAIRLSEGDPESFDAILVDRSTSKDLEAGWFRLMQYVQSGGFLVKLCLQNDGWQPEWLAPGAVAQAFVHDRVVAALPDDCTVLLYDRRIAADATRIVRREGLRWHVVNDIFNGNRRMLYHAGGTQTVVGLPAASGATERIIPLPGRWVNVDGKVGLAVLHGEGQLALRDAAQRQAAQGSISFDDVYFPWSDKPLSCRPGDVVQETVVALLAGADAAESERWAREASCHVAAMGQDGIVLELRTPSGTSYTIRADFAQGKLTCR
jgi:hypothetical protein